MNSQKLEIRNEPYLLATYNRAMFVWETESQPAVLRPGHRGVFIHMYADFTLGLVLAYGIKRDWHPGLQACEWLRRCTWLRRFRGPGILIFFRKCTT